MTTSSQDTFNPKTSLAAHDPARAAREEKAKLDLKRCYSAEMKLWLFCRNVRCYRARYCRGNADDCVGRYAPLVPEEVRDGAHWMLFDDDRSGILGEAPFIDGEEADEALADWHGLVAQACERA
jgi:hypothetical protein